MADPFDAAAVQSLLKAGDPRAAVELINQWLEHEPHNVDSLYHLAVAYRYSDEHNHALETVKQL
ncbi:MAG: tetratricopeptide repeat protein, partial [Pseudomonadota bacterium]|nr:tetratricopeptide repeat protein [Pseudomonadota bacterium]